MYGYETWWVGSTVDAENSEDHIRVIRGHPRSNGVNIGVWTWNLVGGVDCWCWKFWRPLQGHQGSSKVKWGKHWCMDMKCSGWGPLSVQKILKVTSGDQMRSNGVNIGVWTWNLVGGVNCWCQQFWKSLQGYQGSSTVKWVSWWVSASRLGVWVTSTIQGQMGKHWCMEMKRAGIMWYFYVAKIEMCIFSTLQSWEPRKPRTAKPG